MPNSFLRRATANGHAYNVYQFDCSRCGILGEASIRAESGAIIEHGCGLLLIQQPALGMFGRPRLVEVNPCDKEAATHA